LKCAVLACCCWRSAARRRARAAAEARARLVRLRVAVAGLAVVVFDPPWGLTFCPDFVELVLPDAGLVDFRVVEDWAAVRVAAVKHSTDDIVVTAAIR
jgi:hypothetical protein